MIEGLTSRRAAFGAGTPGKTVPVLTHVMGSPFANFRNASLNAAENTAMSNGFVSLEGKATSLNLIS